MKKENSEDGDFLADQLGPEEDSSEIEVFFRSSYTLVLGMVDDWEATDLNSERPVSSPCHNLLLSLLERAMLDLNHIQSSISGPENRKRRLQKNAADWIFDEGQKEFSFNWVLLHLNMTWAKEKIRARARYILQKERCQLIQSEKALAVKESL